MAIDILLKLDGIKGESKISDHEQEIDVLSWSWGADQSGKAGFGSGAGSGKVHVHDLQVTKHIDAASSALVRHVCTGKHISSGTLYIRKAGEKPVNYLTVELTEIIITHFHTGGTGDDDRLVETVSLNFAKFKFEYTTQTDQGTAGPKSGLTWDVAANKAA